jgi:GNAT superfamily N-acetyltransferase
LNWKYSENPFLATPSFIVVRHLGEIVGMRGFYGGKWNLAENEAATIQPHADDLIIHPDHRNRGLYWEIHNASLQWAKRNGFRTLVSLSAGQATQQLSLAAGWQEVGDLENIYRSVVTPSTYRPLYSYARRAKNRFRKIAARSRSNRSSPPSNRSLNKALATIITIKTPRIEVSSEADYLGMSSLSESARSAEFGSPRSEVFLRWRLKNPVKKYRFVYWRDSSLRGYVMLSWSQEDPYRITVADYAVESPDIFYELLDALVCSRRGDFSMMSSTLLDSLLRTAENLGFQSDPNFKKGTQRRFMIYALGESDLPVALRNGARTYPSRWHVSLLDTMHA